MITYRNTDRIMGLSTDTKPTTFEWMGQRIVVPTNALFLELDTGDFYYYDGTTWKKVGE